MQSAVGADPEVSKPGSCWRLQDMSIHGLAYSSLCWSHSPRLEASFWRQFNQLNGHTSAAILPISESCDSLGPTQKMQGHFPISRSLPILPVTCLFQSQVLWIVDTVGDRHSALYSNMFPAVLSSQPPILGYLGLAPGPALLRALCVTSYLTSC